jgi:protein O-GlcNAc transferase
MPPMRDPAGSQSPEFLGGRYQAAVCNIQYAAREKRLSELEGYRLSLQQNPRNAGAYIQLAACYKALGQYTKALSVLREGVERCPPGKDLYREYIKSLQHANRIEEAIRTVDQCLVALPGAADVRLKKRLMLPVVYDTQEEVDHYRRRYQDGLDAFCRETTLDTAAGRASAFEAVGTWVNFFLAYQGRNDRALQHQYGQLLNRVMAATHPQWAGPVAMPPVAPGGKLRVGYVSSHFYRQSVMKNHLGWLQEHDKSKVDVYTYHVGKKVDHMTEEVKQNSIRFWHTPGDLEGACEAIVRDRLHILVFLDIGMNPIMGLMGALRLAPVQCVTWGHPVTPGPDTIDYFISSSLMEPDNAEEHYCEQLVRLPGIGICYRKPVIPRALLLKTREDFGLRGGAVLYLSCHSLFKYLPEHDHVFAEIAQRVPTAQFVFLALNELVAADFYKRLERAFSALGLCAGEHCVMAPLVQLLDYWNLNLVCDVYLDTMTWSGCNTTMEAVACGLPVVTMPGEFMRGRHSYAILTQLGVTETIAHDKAAYVDLAVRLGVDVEWRKSVVARMGEQSARLYGDTSCVRALEAFYERAVAERLGGGK